MHSLYFLHFTKKAPASSQVKSLKCEAAAAEGQQEPNTPAVMLKVI